MRPIPQGQRWPFSAFLRVVIGKRIASARTETSRVRFLTQFLLWWRDVLVQLSSSWDWKIYESTNERMRDGKWMPAQIITERRQSGFSQPEIDAWSFILGIWLEGKPKRQATTAGRASWTPEARALRAANAEAKAKAKIAPKTKPEGGYITPDQVPLFAGPVNRETIFDLTGKKLIIPNKSKRKKKRKKK